MPLPQNLGARPAIAFPGVVAAARCFIRDTAGGAALQPETVTLVAAMTVAPSGARQTLIDNLISSLKSTGLWTKLDFLHVIAAHDAQAGRLNWIAPAGTACAVNGTLTFTVDRGYVGDGTTGYLDTGLTQSGLTQYQQDNCHLGMWIANEVQSGQVALGTITTLRTTLNPRSGSNVQGSRLNCSTQTTFAMSVSKGHSLISRAASTGYDAYKNATLLGSPVQVSTARVAETILYLRSQATFNGNHQVAAGHGGATLNATEATNLYNALNTYMTAVGAAP